MARCRRTSGIYHTLHHRSSTYIFIRTLLTDLRKRFHEIRNALLSQVLLGLGFLCAMAKEAPNSASGVADASFAMLEREAAMREHNKRHRRKRTPPRTIAKKTLDEMNDGMGQQVDKQGSHEASLSPGDAECAVDAPVETPRSEFANSKEQRDAMLRKEAEARAMRRERREQMIKDGRVTPRQTEIGLAAIVGKRGWEMKQVQLLASTSPDRVVSSEEELHAVFSSPSMQVKSSNRDPGSASHDGVGDSPASIQARLEATIAKRAPEAPATSRPPPVVGLSKMVQQEASPGSPQSKQDRIRKSASSHQLRAMERRGSHGSLAGGPSGAEPCLPRFPRRRTRREPGALTTAL